MPEERPFVEKPLPKWYVDYAMMILAAPKESVVPALKSGPAGDPSNA